MKATEQYSPGMLFIMLYKVVLTFETVDVILMCDHSNEIFWAALSCGNVNRTNLATFKFCKTPAPKVSTYEGSTNIVIVVSLLKYEV